MVATSPGAGAILGVVETGYINAVEQNISLDTTAKVPGQNYITIQMFEAVAHSSTPGGLQDVPLANLDMAGEARGTVNYADMKLSPYFVQNMYGPFGYSMGRTELGDLCLYAWQRVAPDLKPGGGTKRGAVNIRALICDSRKTEQELLQVMFQLRIKGVTGLAKRAPAAIGAFGVILTPAGMTVPGDVLPDLPPAPPRVTRPAVPSPEQADELALPPSSASPVPAPAEPLPPPTGIPGPQTGPGNDVPIVPLPTLVAPPAADPPVIAAST
jgi:hypothetical protein